MKIDGFYAVQSQKYMKTNKKKKDEATEKLSSGYKINKAADDAAGLSLSEDMRRQVRGLERASLNSQEGISAMQIADGAMAEVQEMLNRGLELCIESANGTHSDSDRKMLQDEVEQIKTEIDAIAERTYYNELEVLKGQGKTLSVPEPNSKMEVVYQGKLPDWVGIAGTVKQDGYMSQTFETTKTYTDANGKDHDVTVNHSAAILDFSKFVGSRAQINELNGMGFHFTDCTGNSQYSIRFTKGSDSSTESSGNHLIYNVGIQGAKNADDIINRMIQAADNGNPAGHYTKLEQDGKNLVIYDDRSSDPSNTYPDADTWKDWKNSAFDTKANEDNGKFGEGVASVQEGYNIVESARYGSGESISIQACSETGEMVPIELPYLSCSKIGIDDVDIGTADGAVDGIDKFKEASAYVSGERSRCGAYQNRLEHSIDNVDNTAENMTASESRIRDADMVEEQMKFSKNNILTQAGQAILAQANQSYQGVVNLLTFN